MKGEALRHDSCVRATVNRAMLIKYGYGMLFDGDVMLRESVLKCSEVA